MGIILNLALLATGIGAFIGFGGPQKVEGFVNTQLEKSGIDNTPVPIDAGDGQPQTTTILNFTDNGSIPTRETIPTREIIPIDPNSFTIETIPGTNIPIAIPTSEPIQGPSQPASVSDPIVQSTQVQTGIEDQTFEGGGISFIGGQVTETPIRFLSLSQIIDRFGVSASKARDIQASATGEFDDFDFGTNTGFGFEGSSATAIQQSLQDRLKAEEEKALQIFDSGSISNF